MPEIGDWVGRYLQAVWAITAESAGWVMASLVLGGLIREFLPSSRFQRLLNAPGYGALGGAVLVGALLPICSCGVVPLAISLHRSGVRIGPVMAFTAATPMINPAAVILATGLLGPQLTLAYVGLGLVLPLLLGVAAERWSGVTPVSPGGPTGSGAVAHAPAATGARVAAGLRWGLLELGPSVAFYLAVGVLLAGLVMAAAPTVWLDRYLGAEAFTSLLVVGGLGAVIYVCAVAHIPLVATLLAAGAAPGAAIVFLVTGTATNLPELLALHKALGRRVIVVYVLGLVGASFAAGLAVNAWLLPGFAPVFDPLQALDVLARGDASLPWGAGLERVSAAVLAGLASWGAWQRIRRRGSSAAPAVDAASGACCKHEQSLP